jgi:hypothetical protein
VRVQVDRDLTTVSWVDRLLGLIKNLGRHKVSPLIERKQKCVEIDASHFVETEETQVHRTCL